MTLTESRHAVTTAATRARRALDTHLHERTATSEQALVEARRDLERLRAEHRGLVASRGVRGMVERVEAAL